MVTCHFLRSPIVGENPKALDARNNCDWVSEFDCNNVAVCTLKTMPFAIHRLLKLEAPPPNAAFDAKAAEGLALTGTALAHVRRLLANPHWNFCIKMSTALRDMHLHMTDLKRLSDKMQQVTSASALMSRLEDGDECFDVGDTEKLSKMLREAVDTLPADVVALYTSGGSGPKS